MRYNYVLAFGDSTTAGCELIKDSEDYLKRLKELREDIEKEMQKKTFKGIYENVFKLI